MMIVRYLAATPAMRLDSDGKPNQCAAQSESAQRVPSYKA
jgi:hypothetical protein